jgi:hypothetical protein
MGIETAASHVSRTRRDSPRPSDPSTSTRGPVAHGNESSDIEPPASSPTTIRPEAAQSLRVRTRLVARETCRRAAAPAEVRHATAVIPAERRCGTSNPCAPNAAAERTTAPKLRGSVTPSNATSSGGVAESSAAANTSSGRAYSYGSTCSATP